MIFNVDPRERSFSIILGTGKFLWRQLGSFLKWMLSQRKAVCQPKFPNAWAVSLMSHKLKTTTTTTRFHLGIRFLDLNLTSKDDNFNSAWWTVATSSNHTTDMVHVGVLGGFSVCHPILSVWKPLRPAYPHPACASPATLVQIQTEFSNTLICQFLKTPFIMTKPYKTIPNFSKKVPLNIAVLTPSNPVFL